MSDEKLEELIEEKITSHGKFKPEVAEIIRELHRESGVYFVFSGYLANAVYTSSSRPATGVITGEQVIFIWLDGLIRLKLKRSTSDLLNTEVAQQAGSGRLTFASNKAWEQDSDPTTFGYNFQPEIDGEYAWSHRPVEAGLAAKSQTEIDTIRLVFEKVKEKRVAASTAARVTNAQDRLDDLGLDL